MAIANRDSGMIGLASPMQLQRWRENAWHLERVLPLRAECNAPYIACIELAPGAELFPPALGSGACACEPCPPLPKGRYRFVIQSCAHDRTISSQAFEHDPRFEN